MTRVLFLGGPRNNERHDVPDDLPTRLMVMPWPVGSERSEPVGYTLQSWPGGHAYVADGYLQIRVGCVAPGCESEARMTFTVEADGRLASRDWRAGDLVEVCPEHGSDIYRAQGQRVEELPEWLRVDAVERRRP